MHYHIFTLRDRIHVRAVIDIMFLSQFSKLSALSPFGIMFRAAYSPWEMKTFWVLVNTVEDEASHVSNAFSKPDTALFFRIIDELMEEGGVITVHQVEELGSELNINNESTKSGLHRMDRLKWLKILRQRDEGPCVTFGARSMTELPRVRAFVRSYTSEGAEAGAARQGRYGQRETVDAMGSNQPAQEDAEDIVVPVRSRSRRLPRLSQNTDDIDANVEMRDEDEDEIRPVQPRRSSRRVRR